MTQYTPEGYNSASPYLIVSDAAATIRFLKAVEDSGGTPWWIATKVE